MTEEIKQHGHFRRNWFTYTLLIVAVGISTFLWISKHWALKKQASLFQKEKVALIGQAEQALKANGVKHLEMMMKTFVWAVRGEMSRGNLEQVDQYFKQLVKSENIKEITLIDKKGKILISTNKKNEGDQLAKDYAKTVLKSEEVTIISKELQEIVSAPVMSLDSRLGTLVIIYQPDEFKLTKTLDLTQKE